MHENFLYQSTILLKSEGFVVVPIELSKKIGRASAALLQNIHCWLKTDSGVVSDGRKWIYNTYAELAEKIGVSQATIKRSIRILKDAGYLFVEKLNQNKNDRTNYYTINYAQIQNDFEDILKNQKQHKKKVNQDQNDLIHPVKMTRCIQREPKVLLIKSEPVGSASAPNKVSSDMDKEAITITQVAKKKQQEEGKSTVRKDTAKDMLDIWNKHINGSNKEKYVAMTKGRARFLVAAFQRKFDSCMKKWKEFCQMIENSDFLMGKTFHTKKFNLSFDWTIRFSTIDRLLDGDLGCKKPEKSPLESDQEMYEQGMDFVNQEENETLKTYKKRVLNFFKSQRRSGAFLAWLKDCKWIIEEETNTLRLATKTNFNASFIMQHLANDLKKLLDKKVECFVVV